MSDVTPLYAQFLLHPRSQMGKRDLLQAKRTSQTTVVKQLYYDSQLEKAEVVQMFLDR
jgi:hypothetical protein